MIKKILRYTLLISFLGLLVYTFYYLYEKNQEPDTVYELTSPEYRDIVRKTVATGSVTPRQEVLIKPQVSGIIDKIYVEEGSKIKVGDLIAKVDTGLDLLSNHLIYFRSSVLILEFFLYSQFHYLVVLISILPTQYIFHFQQSSSHQQVLFVVEKHS